MNFSGVNTRLAFDSQILLPKNQRDQLKLIFKINTASSDHKNKRISTKTLKINDNNQYGNPMSKPLPYGCIKKMKKIPSLREFYKTLNNISHADNMGHLFIVNIMYHLVIKKTLFNKVYTPIFEKSKLIKPYERFTLQLLSVLSKNEEKNIINTFKDNTKAYSTMKEKKIIPRYAEHLHFLLIRADWLVTKIYQHYTLEQACLKKTF